jgi:hypothetical protein
MNRLEGETANCSSMLFDELSETLDSGDDVHLWQFAISTILEDSLAMIRQYRGKDAVVVEIGRCSHWIRPHWTHSKHGTRFPAGYDKTATGFGLQSLPNFDWSIRRSCSFEPFVWSELVGQPSRRPLTLRIAIPARTANHSQATIHTIWTPGSPAASTQKLTTIYGFERMDNAWRCFARWDSEHSS